MWSSGRGFLELVALFRLAVGLPDGADVMFSRYLSRRVGWPLRAVRLPSGWAIWGQMMPGFTQRVAIIDMVGGHLECDWWDSRDGDGGLIEMLMVES